jgi:hypothetical protein
MILNDTYSGYHIVECSIMQSFLLPMTMAGRDVLPAHMLDICRVVVPYVEEGNS